MENPVDPNVVNVSQLLFSRMNAGFYKYGTNTTREDLTTEQWLQHLQEELLDAAIYVQVLKGKMNELKRLSETDTRDSNLPKEPSHSLPSIGAYFGSWRSSRKDQETNS